MAHRRSSIKKIRIDKRRREQNLRILSELKTYGRKLAECLRDKKAAEAEKAYRAYVSKLDRAVKKSVLHDNKASRRKSRLGLKLNALRAAAPKTS